MNIFAKGKEVMNGKILYSQLFVMLILFETFEILSYSERLGDASYNGSVLVAIVLSFVLRAIILIPAYFVYKQKGEQESCITANGKFTSKAQSLLNAGYVLLLTAFACADNIRFCHFITVCPVPDFSAAWISLLLIAGAVYCALKGREAVFRAGTLITFAVLIATILMVVMMAISTKQGAYTSVMYDFDSSDILKNTMKITGGSLSIPVLLLFLYGAKGNAVRGFWWWNTAITALMLAIFAAVFCNLGTFGKQNVFPVYVAINAASFGVLRRFDALFMCTLALGLVIRLAAVFLLIKEFAKGYYKGILLLCALAVFIAGVAARSAQTVITLNNPYFKLTAIIVLAIALPCAMLLKGRRVA